MEDRLLGKHVAGCLVIKQIGQGGMARIYLAQQESIGREVVIKLMARELTHDPLFVQRFLREVTAMGRLQHPHIVPIYDHGEFEGVPYITMAYMPGGSLKERLDRQGRLPLDEVSRIGGQVALALSHAHEKGIIHRDIKPANILFDSEGNAMLTDFGIARLMDGSRDITTTSTIGTVSYIAPEMIDTRNKLTPATDVYALGVTVFELLTGRLPFESESTMQMMWAHVYEPVPLIDSLNPSLPPDLDDVIQCALAKAPEARYATAPELTADLARVARGEKPQAAERTPSPLRMHTTDQLASPSTIERMVSRVMDQVVKISRPDGGRGAGIYVPDSLILTVLHVVDGATGIYIGFRNGEAIEADLIALDRTNDLALLRLRSIPKTLSEDQINRIDFSDSSLDPGEVLVAIGHPLGLDWSVTGGHFNAIRHPHTPPLDEFGITLDCDLVQVDVPINPGNSGGPLLDLQGRLVGIADSIINPIFATNIGFAIHAPVAFRFLADNRDTDQRFAAYSDGHHYPLGMTYSLTGKPVTLLEPAPMPSQEGVIYTCGHHHPPGLRFCPMIGKPIYPVRNDAASDAPHKVRPGDPVASVVCTNCQHVYALDMAFCPLCGKPQPRPVA